MRKAAAFCPGHVTGFFEICPSEDILRMGSRGAGLCLSLGASTSVSLERRRSQKITIFLNGKKARANVSRAAVGLLLGQRNLDVVVKTRLDLPVSQGFGMSAAGALSTAIALAEIIGEPKQRAFEAAHAAEIRCGGGLGDVSAIHRAGITIRDRPGLPPTGHVMRIRGKPQVVLAVIGDRLPTKRILSSRSKRCAINKHGSMMMREIIDDPRLETLMRLSNRFALESGLASRQLTKVLRSASAAGQASMAMLGNSVFAIGDVDDLKKTLRPSRHLFVCEVDTRGPRVL